MIGITAGISGSDISLNDGTIVPLGPYGQRRGIVAWSTLNLDINKELEVAKRHENSSQNKIGDFVDFNTLATRQSDFVFAPLRTANGSYFCPAHDGMSPTAIFDGLTRCDHFIPIGSETALNPTRETAQFLLPTCWRCVCAHGFVLTLSHRCLGVATTPYVYRSGMSDSQLAVGNFGEFDYVNVDEQDHYEGQVLVPVVCCKERPIRGAKRMRGQGNNAPPSKPMQVRGGLILG